MKGILVQFRRGRHTVHERHYLIDLGLKGREEAKGFSGKEVVWRSPGKNSKEIKGRISDAHGNKGLVRAIFEKGLPGQAMTTEIEVLGSEVSEKTEKKEKGKKEGKKKDGDN
ncbi:MAG: 50S ribosomal protein L35ae [Candidatus Pacearchaeota archaeon]|nr:50S ribosomal protein L35ae [Candidatus Pacearchaeota archaeon]